MPLGPGRHEARLVLVDCVNTGSTRRLSTSSLGKWLKIDNKTISDVPGPQSHAVSPVSQKTPRTECQRNTDSSFFAALALPGSIDVRKPFKPRVSLELNFARRSTPGSQVRRHGSQRGTAPQGAGGREPAAEADGGRPQPGQGSAEGDRAKKRLELSMRRPTCQPLFSLVQHLVFVPAGAARREVASPERRAAGKGALRARRSEPLPASTVLVFAICTGRAVQAGNIPLVGSEASDGQPRSHIPAFHPHS